MRSRGGPRRIPERNPQAADDVPTYYLGGIAERAEAEVADMGELGALEVSEWGMCMMWLKGKSWEDVKRLVGVQTIRPSGRYTGPFHTLYRKCFAMIIKVWESSVDEAKLLSKKLTFLLPRLIYAPVEGEAEINKVLIKRAERFLKGEWEGLYDDYVESSNRVTGVTGAPTLSSQRARAVRLMEAGLVAKSVGLLGVSKICDVRRGDVMEQLKSQVVFEDEGGGVRASRMSLTIYIQTLSTFAIQWKSTWTKAEEGMRITLPLRRTRRRTTSLRLCVRCRG